MMAEQQPGALSRRIVGHIRLADPITWVSPLLMCLCGALAAGRGTPGFDPTTMADLGTLLLGMLMIGPLATGFSQSINDYFDRELDAINDPTRPIPAGDVTLTEARSNWLVLGAATLLLSLAFGKWEVTALAVVGLLLAVAYSVPPVKLKKHVWLGAPSVGLGYVVVSWLTMHIIFAPITWPSVITAFVNGIMVAGLLFLNDIKSVEGDRLHGLKSLTVTLGSRRAVLVAFGVISGCQVLLLALAYVWGYRLVALAMLVMILLPMPFQVQLWREPSHANFLRYTVVSNPFAALIQLCSAAVVAGYFRMT